MRKLFFCISYLAGTAAFAQELTIEELWNSAAAYEKLQQAATSVSIADAKVKAEKGGRLPLIYAEGILQRNLIIPATPVPAIAFDPNAGPGEIIPLKFATNWTARGGLQFTMDLFNPKKIVAIKTATVDQESAQLDYELATKEWKKNATAAYAKVILSSRQYEEALQDSARYVQIVAIVEERNRSGRASDLELNRARQELLNKQTQLAEAFRVLEVANTNLATYTDTDKYSTVSTSIESIIAKLQTDGKQLEIEQLALDRKKLAVQQQNLKLEALPTFSLNAFYGSQYFKNGLDLLNTHYWYGNSYINLALRMPVSEALDRAITRKRLSLEKQLVESKYREQLSIDSASRKEQTANIQYAQKALENARSIEQLSAQNVALVQEQYLAGRILLTEVNQELSTHFKNKQSTWQAEYDYLLAVLETL